MRNRSKTPKRVIAAALTTLFLSHQTMLISVVASEITGITNSGSGTFNIDPSSVVGDKKNVGVRQYEKFNLDKGDIANLNYKYGENNIETFVNLVDNQINVNGIINTVRDNSFYNGKAVFISPNGMVVGASGVLNVGSLGVYTPNTSDFETLKSFPALLAQDGVLDPRLRNSTVINGELFSNILNNESRDGVIDIQGKVFARGDVDLVGANVNIAKNGGVITGLNESYMNSKIGNWPGVTIEKKVGNLLKK